MRGRLIDVAGLPIAVSEKGVAGKYTRKTDKLKDCVFAYAQFGMLSYEMLDDISR